jgi:hypothetical protein
LVIPVRIPSAAQVHQLEIVATGQKNPAAQGSEVWVTGLMLDGCDRVPASAFELDGNWEVRDGVPLSHQQQPAMLRWQGTVDGEAELRLVSHPWSGIVTVTWDGASQTLDLYSDRAADFQTELSLFAATPSLLLPIITFLADAITLGVIVLALGLWLATRPVRPKSVQVGRWSWLGYAIPCLVVWSIYLLAVWPGSMTPDSISQWRQMLLGPLVNEHPVFHTLTNWLITRLWLSPAAVALAQMAALATVFGFTIRELEFWGIPKWVRWLVVIVFSLSPINGLLVTSLWKDVPYTIALLGLFAILLRLVQTNGVWLKSWRGPFLLWLALMAASLYRLNGLAVSALFILLLLVLWRQRTYLARVALIGLAWLGTIVLITGPMYQALGVTSMSPGFQYQILYNHIGAVIKSGAALSAADQVFLEQIQPLPAWRNNYFCYSVVPIMFYQPPNTRFVDQHADEFRDLALRLGFSHLDALVQNQLCVTSIIWRITQPADGYFYTASPGIISNDLGLATRSKWPWLYDTLTRFTNWSSRADQAWWLWRPALYLYLALASITLAAIRLRRKNVLLLMLPIALNSLVWLVLIVAQDFRYHYPVYVIGLIAPALLFAQPTESTANN